MGAINVIRGMYRDFPAPRVLWLAFLVVFPVRILFTYEVGTPGWGTLIGLIMCLVAAIAVPAIAAWAIYVVYLLPLGLVRLLHWIDPIDDRRVFAGGLLAALIGAMGFMLVIPKSDPVGFYSPYVTNRPKPLFGSAAGEIVFWVITAAGLIVGFIFALPRRTPPPGDVGPPIEGGT